MNKKGKWIIGISGSLVIGALGSGLWNGVFSPIFIFFGRGLMSLLTVFYSSERDDVYDRAAVGLHELSSNLILMIFGVLFLFFPIALYLTFFFAFSRQKKRRKLNKRREGRKNKKRKAKDFLAFDNKCLLCGVVIHADFISCIFQHSNKPIQSRIR
ncbi:MAG: hypothetical protein WBQ21_09595 [Solirubrobacteraceae bacterium]